MGWLEAVQSELAAGRHVRLRGSGTSMRPRINDGEVITLAPLAPGDEVRVGDILLARVPSGRHFVHEVKEVAGGEERYLIGNTRGELDGWVGRAEVFGRVVYIGDDSPFGGALFDDQAS